MEAPVTGGPRLGFGWAAVRCNVNRGLRATIWRATCPDRLHQIGVHLALEVGEHVPGQRVAFTTLSGATLDAEEDKFGRD